MFEYHAGLDEWRRLFGLREAGVSHEGAAIAGVSSEMVVEGATMNQSQPFNEGDPGAPWRISGSSSVFSATDTRRSDK